MGSKCRFVKTWRWVNDDWMLIFWGWTIPLSVSVLLHVCMFVAASSPNSLYVGSSAASTARTMFTRGVNYCSLTHHIISLCLDLLPHSLVTQPALSTDTERESQSSIFSALCLPCAMFFGALPPLHMHSRKRTLLQMLPISHWKSQFIFKNTQPDCSIFSLLEFQTNWAQKQKHPRKSPAASGLLQSVESRHLVVFQSLLNRARLWDPRTADRL